MAQTPVYSTVFIEVGAANHQAGYVVPAGKVIVVRSVSVLFVGTPGNTSWGLKNAATNVFLAYHWGLDTDEFVHFDLRQVVPAGSELLSVSFGPNTVYARACGYLLSTP
jgi:hypothetical protein